MAELTTYPFLPSPAQHEPEWQGTLFSPGELPRGLPVFKAGPDDGFIFERLANRGWCPITEPVKH